MIISITCHSEIGSSCMDVKPGEQLCGYQLRDPLVCGSGHTVSVYTTTAVCGTEGNETDPSPGTCHYNYQKHILFHFSLLICNIIKNTF